ncbi:Structural maintenance of chromosomes protein 4 [Exophiala dermatitidis]|uniref:Structural maintenance of chromosomes protein 4 n=1 Tax=Exophiala dermatitidis TaxID=5970 RepID=A0AAN6IRZ5_EXODE|nr:Structural maintenance of chromosomes protein 4 [Exophiala dermatitidis]KAJ4510467.1 Structural maintenance of chromosomes protein 4 [Exophiala dermatitidis]KAJ4510599.1 Structural maintenance of chromosomes protein 4 [Exophiala dermatitidis]KAJ4535079.1 Structural maintenance of chromosomes protein 4 [Exophiala dermatitidis]KAJ4536147.1 Structural maintenance of chromosomes protein 4 [Exophiala dermatitidis]
MASGSPVRPSRRAARKTFVVEDDSDDELSLVKEEENDNDEEFTPAPKRSPRKSTARRQTMGTVGSATPRKSTTRQRKVKTGENIEPSQIFDPEQTMAPSEPPSSPTKSPSPRKQRKSTTGAPRRGGRRSSATPPVPPLPAMTNANATELLEQNRSSTSTPLKDITTKALNQSAVRPQQLDLKDSARPMMVAPLEKPMDIVIRARAQAQAAPAVVEEPTGPKSRMVIRQLVMNNFKSYAGRQVVGPFHASFSAVVGPNGSGKSNVIDSLLFVFGFRASKMRQGKISALIHNSAQHPDLDYCEVEVYFQEIVDLPGGKHEVVPGSDLVVSRKAFKNNSSNYYLNGRTTNFTTVTTLLKEKGIDLDHKRFLILQGEVESIAQMKPKAANEHDDGLLEYLEDIIGTSKYKTPIEEAAVELESLNEVCIEKQGRVQHVEKEKNSLEDKKNKALAFIRDENELAEKQSALYQIYIAECEDNAKVTEEAIEEIQQQLSAELEKHAGSEDTIQQLEKAYSKAVKQYESIQKQAQEFAKELAKYDKENVKFEEKRKFITGKQKKAEKVAQSSRLTASEAQSLVEKYTDDIQRKSAEVAELEKEMQREEQELAVIRENLKGKTQGLSDQIAAKQKSLEPWNAKINQKQSAIAVAQSELDILKEKATSGQKAIDQGNAKIESIEANREEKLQEIEQRKYEKARLEKDVRKIQDALQKLAASEPDVRAQISSARQKADEARASLASSQNQSNVLKGLLRLKDSGRIDGFHGRLGNLGTIDERYDVAISTACPALENMVVDNVEVGQQCIEYLRKNNLGRANFILLDKLAKRDLSPIQTPENVPRLFDLIKPKDQRFAPAFYSIMQNTLVAKDLEQANRIAYGAKRWRVVTLDGQLIDVSGTMSGGGTRVARGAMSSKLSSDTSKEQVQQLEGERDQLERQFEAFQGRQRELEASLREKQEEIPRLETVIQKINLEVETCTRNLADAQKRVQDLIAELKTSSADDFQIKALEKQIAVINKELDELHSETATLEAEIQALQDKIMEVGGIQLRSQKARVDGLKERIDMLNDDISNAEVARTKNEKLKIKNEKAKADAEKELESLAKDAERLEEDLERHESGAGELGAKADQVQEEQESMKEELAALKKDLDTQTSELNSTRAIEIEMKNKLEEHQKILADNNKKSRYWAEKLSKLALHDIADLEGITEGQDEQTSSEQEQEQQQQQQQSNEDEDAEMTDIAQEDPDAMDVDEEEQQQQVEQTEHEPASEVRRARRQLQMFTRDELLDKSKDHLVASIAALEEKVSNASSIDISVIAEYRRRCEEVASRTSDLKSAVKTRDAAKTRLTDLRNLRLTQFMTGFTTISSHLKSMYQLITLGGNAELELVDSLDPFSEGILFSVMPPKKSWKNIGNLSGGEKTLSSLALVFALHVYRPTPLYVMDEIDAALDFRNVSIVAGYIKERTKNAQFIVISLRNNMFELAERLVGIYKVNHMTKSVTVENRDYLAMSRQQQQQQRHQQQQREQPQQQQQALEEQEARRERERERQQQQHEQERRRQQQREHELKQEHEQQHEQQDLEQEELDLQDQLQLELDSQLQ